MVKNLHRPLLGRPAIENLELLARINNIAKDHHDPVQKFSHLFQGLGKLEGNYTIKLKNGTEPYVLTTPRRVYTIKLKNGTEPYVLTTPRRVPIPLMEAVRKELQRMEELGVITPVTEHTKWW